MTEFAIAFNKTVGLYFRKMLPLPNKENEGYSTTIYVANIGLWVCLGFHSNRNHTQKLYSGEPKR